MDKWERSRLTRRLCCCCCSVLLLLLIAVAVIAIVARVVLKPKDVNLNVNSITLQSFDFSLDIPVFNPNISLILDMDIRVYNPNRASFRFENSTVYMYYHGNESARTHIPAGKIPARDSVNISTVLDVDATKILSNSKFSSDLSNGTLPVTTQSSVRGRVNVWNIYRHRMVSISRCFVLLSITNRTLISYECVYKRVF